MTFIDIADYIIPGFSNLSDQQQRAFLASNAGKLVQEFIEKKGVNITKDRIALSWWDFSFLFVDIEQEEPTPIAIGNDEKKVLIDNICKEDGYEEMITNIVLILLKKEYPNFVLLDEHQQLTLAAMPGSYELLAQLIPLNRSLNANESRPLTLVLEKTIIKKRWYDQHLKEPLEAKMTHFSQFFPLLSHYQIMKLPVLTVNELLENVDANKEAYLAQLIKQCLEMPKKIASVNLETINNMFIEDTARLIINQYTQQKPLDLDTHLNTFKEKLTAHINEQLLLIHDKPWPIPQSDMQELIGSLSYMAQHSSTKDEIITFVNKVADAHSFIQATSFATQNENSYLATLDICNYARSINRIAEVKSIVSSLFAFLIPLYEEYKNNAFHEKNTFWKLFRTIMPMLIVVGFVALIASVLAPLALPELAFTLILIPTIIVGLALAASYVNVKNDLYKSLRNYYYGGPFEVPEFQINARMTSSSAFKTKETALVVRNRYIEAIKKCDEDEQFYYQKYINGTLKKKEIDLRKDNSKKRTLLGLEWYDIHSNINLDCSQASIIAKARLEEESQDTYNSLKETLEKKDVDTIEQSITQVINDLKTALTLPPSNSTISPNRPLTINYSSAFFKMVSHSIKGEVERLVDDTQTLMSASC